MIENGQERLFKALVQTSFLTLVGIIRRCMLHRLTCLFISAFQQTNGELIILLSVDGKSAEV